MKEIPNPLSYFEQVAYHFELYTTESPTGTGTRYVLARSGVTGYSIQDVEFDSFIAPNHTTRGTNATQFRITIVEPIGTSFFDALVMAARAINKDNYTKYVYWLELSFKGYENGVEKPNVLEGQQYGERGTGKWRWPIHITNIESTLDTGGGTYSITAVPYYESIFNNSEEFTSRDTMTIHAETVGEFFDKLGEVMTQKAKINYESESEPVFEYQFSIDESQISGIRQFKLLAPDDELSDGRNRPTSLEEDNPVRTVAIQIMMGTPVSDIVDMIFANTKEGQDMARAGPSAAEDTGQDSDLNAGPTQERIVFRTYPNTEILNPTLHSKTRKYSKRVTYNIAPYICSRAKLTPDDVDSPTYESRVGSLSTRNAIAKHYHYIYTGLNTEVLNFDMKFNFAWSANLPRLKGFRQAFENVVIGDRFNEDIHTKPESYNPNDVSSAAGATASRAMGSSIMSGFGGPAGGIAGMMGGGIGEMVRTAQSATSQINQTAGNLTNTLNSSIQEGPVGQALSNLNSSGSAINNISNQVSGFADGLGLDFNLDAPSVPIFNLPNVPDLSFRGLLNGPPGGSLPELSSFGGSPNLPSGGNDGSRVYLERQTSSNGRIPIDFVVTQEDSRANSGTGATHDWDRGKSIYGIILDQIYGPSSNELINSTLEIKGDPYWLGLSGTEYATSFGRPSNEFNPNFTTGEHGYILTIRYPQNVNSQGRPNIRQQDIFSGLYIVTQVKHSFSGGVFKQSLIGFRDYSASAPGPGEAGSGTGMDGLPAPIDGSLISENNNTPF